MSVAEYVEAVIKTGLIADPRIVYELTMYELQVLLEGLCERERARMQENHIYFGTLTAAVYNSRRTKRSDRVWAWNDFYRDLSKTEEKREMTDDEIYQTLRMMFGGGGNG